MELTAAEKQQAIDSFIPDKFRDLTGPVRVSKDWLRELSRIDPKLVLRWQPFWRRYAVFMVMETGKLWSQPVHIVATAADGMRVPDSRDLSAIRQANWHFRNSGAKDKINALARWDEDRLKADREHMRNSAHERARDACRRNDVSTSRFAAEHLGITRKAWTDGTGARHVAESDGKNATSVITFDHPELKKGRKKKGG